MNGEGYRDPTADRAIRNATHLPRQIWSVVKAVREVLNVSHLELVEIKMRDRTTGREHKWGGDTSGSAQRGEREEKEYLRRYHAAELAEREIREEIDDLRMNKMFPALIQDGMPHGSSCGDLSAYVVQLEELMDNLKAQMEQQIRLKKRNHAENRRDAG